MMSQANLPGPINKVRVEKYYGDQMLIMIAMLLVSFGLIMMTSASVEIAGNKFNDPLYYLKKQSLFLLVGIISAWVVVKIPLRIWDYFSGLLMIVALGMLVAVLIPGIGKEVNGSIRWIDLGVMRLQASEPAKLLIIIFIASFLSKNRNLVCSTWKGFILPLVFIAPPIYLLLEEPDFGAVVVLFIAVIGMMFLAGVKIYQFVLTIIVALGGVAGLIYSAPYRLERVITFIKTLSDPFNEEVVYGSGYQLAQALIGFGRGEWFGVGLGNSIQKLYFLPEAHTDFVLAIIAEELGFITVLVLIGLFFCFVGRAISIARRNENLGKYFSAYLGYGISFVFLAQVLINIAVNTGLAPTKGLTLPFLSSGGSSLIICLVMLGILLRIDIESYEQNSGKSK